MILAAVYIPCNSIPHIFGDKHDGMTLNMGAKYLYKFKENEESIELIQRTENPDYIDGFWGDKVSLVTSIVGKNGAGKTSILRAINDRDKNYRKCLFIFETYSSIGSIDKSEWIAINESDKEIKGIVKFPYPEKTKKRDIINTLFYSPVLDNDFKDTYSPITSVFYHTGTLEEYFLNEVGRNLFFLKSDASIILNEIYEDFPSYDKLEITAYNERRNTLTSSYAQVNFATPHRGEALKNKLIGELGRLKREEDKTSLKFNISNKIDFIEDSIRHLESESFINQFDKLWSIEDYKIDASIETIHNNENLKKDVEINILSYLLLGAVFPRTGLGGGYDFDEILTAETFSDKLNSFFEFYLANEYESLHEKIYEDVGRIDIREKNKILNIVDNDKYSSFNGLKLEPIRERIRLYIAGFYSIHEFYELFLKITKSTQEKSFFIEIEKMDITLFNSFILKYEEVLSFFNKKLPVKCILLNIKPNKKLSSGEKALLSFYSSVYDYIDKRYNPKQHSNNNNFLLLLDEPELGYHPEWKKKFVDAITRTLPIIFSEIDYSKLDKKGRKYDFDQGDPEVQVIFTTHDPLTLSDLPNNSVIYLDKQNERTVIESSEGKNTFGANITDLLADSFYVKEGLIGNFAKYKIQETIRWLNNLDDLSNIEYHRKFIYEIVDEPIVKRKLSEMFDKKVDSNNTINLLEKQIKELEELRDKYRKNQ